MQARLIEVACDESGFSGTNLLDSSTPVFAHASVQLSVAAAQRCVDVVGARFAYASGEVKSNHLLRRRQRSLLEWLLGRSGPLLGHAHVHLTDKAFFVVFRAVELSMRDASYAAGTSLDPDLRAIRAAVALHRAGADTFRPGAWRNFLRASVTLMRFRRDPEASAHDFARALTALRSSATPKHLAQIVAALHEAPLRLGRLRTELLAERRLPPLLEPLIPALVQTVLYWAEPGVAVSIVHDEQSALTPHRVSQIQELLVSSGPGQGADHPTRLLGVRRVDSQSDPRIQVADYLAGAARRIASEALAGNGDPELVALLRPYVDPYSMWPDDRSWRLLSDSAEISPLTAPRTLRPRSAEAPASW